jgi:AmmeMemoRadiSam system protein B
MAFRNWYAGDCRRQVEEFLEGYSPPGEAKRIHAAAVPHAGWRYSGRVAARTLKALAARSPEALFLLSAAHRAASPHPAVYPAGEWQTPLGPVEVDAELAGAVLQQGGDYAVADPYAHAGEHSLEVQLPIVRALLPEARIVPILTPPEAAPVRLGELLATVAGERNIAAVATTDLTHYGEPYGFAPAGRGPGAHEWMRANDQRILDLALALRADEIVDEAHRHHNACGAGALAAAVAYARERGATEGRLLERTDSHEVTGGGQPFEMAVGYAGMVFC